MHGPAKAMRAAIGGLVDFALPPRCPGCGAITPADHSFCIRCWSGLHFLGPPCCARCGLPFDYDGGAEAECGACLADSPAYASLRAAVAYGETARRVVLKLKYGGRPGVAATLAHFMRRHVPTEGNAILAPVPLHRWRIWRRGYNQSALIASALATRTGLAAELDLLQRVKATPPFRNMGRRERALTVRGAFRVNPARKPSIVGKAILLVDDVYTTGATVNACAKTLLRAGAREVNIICWARVIRGID